MNLGLANSFIEKCLIKKSRLFVGLNNLHENLHTKPFCTVVNADGHFVGLIGSSTYLLYYDPFGLIPMDQEIIGFCKKDPRPLLVNYATHQHPVSLFCGFFVLLFVLLHEYHAPNLHPFRQDDLIANDTICIQNLEKLLIYNVRIN